MMSKISEDFLGVIEGARSPGKESRLYVPEVLPDGALGH